MTFHEQMVLGCIFCRVPSITDGIAYSDAADNREVMVCKRCRDRVAKSPCRICEKNMRSVIAADAYVRGYRNALRNVEWACANSEFVNGKARAPGQRALRLAVARLGMALRAAEEHRKACGNRKAVG